MAEVTNAVKSPQSLTLHERRMKAVPKAPYNITQVYVESAQGATVCDIDGNRYIDFAGGIGIQNVGHCHPKVVQAIQEQAARSIHTCFHVAPYESYIQLAERLNDVTPGLFEKKTMFLNSGAEAVENAVKIARKYTGKPGVISFDRGYHGRTLLTMSLTSKVKPYKHGFGPFANSTYKMPYPYYYRAPENMDPESYDDFLLSRFEDFFVADAATDEIGAVIMEPVQGEGGFIVPSKKFVQGVKRICEKNDILFIADEIQTGFGRTGQLFGMNHFDVAPDLLTMSKSLAAGMPLSAVTGRAAIMDTPDVGQLGGTFAGSPMSCAASLAVLDVIEEEEIVKKAQNVGKQLMAAFHHLQNKYDLIGDVRGLGAMCAMELVEDRKTKEPATAKTAEIVKYCWQHGLFALSAGMYSNVLRFLPPLIISDDELREGISILESAFESVTK
ncbi:4-aminobutyrate aminotransferase [Schinkia azotoformans MEV2011]|uniref:(S)-3-amino-2-methylpropionate transaminase n=1 Tax=Schinkia azotoformans MEV2011 TaxID=1348973 RepID=A0A072NLG3_SCHAZ|nr:4-aminobutyrate--2-oxoglutarate transaminase [Schinkia azotoformans]KEF38519.1 4-aminobutyrate aminotransferase [Schinkia azotoformans MEV2011]MEC1695128.1 4-aminobutyrate--2-oxoglutarate transaminase [Schinkia azotoformans]MEC1717698.1 4-aminobutyrate--2-oxoglutarate transaminase [Schinkia azotoformans]MEC1723813.1 4-aminobutyrate--2-oxoglutarate transaminase [Schinkia azotoformans]MEC1742364.1 4-aminobutyrate--2-oxoglutarate transaminase [Schinkia azotoformans]